jgi:hypothetical protein
MTHHVVALPLRRGCGDFPAAIGSSSLVAPRRLTCSDRGGGVRPAGAVAVAVVLRYLASKTRRRFPGLG